MSAIPPSIYGVLQSPLVQGQASAVRDSEEAARLNAERRQTAAITETDSTVETTDNDTQVHTDAEGSGSQGRAFNSPAEQSAPTEPEAACDDGSHIDIEA